MCLSLAPRRAWASAPPPPSLIFRACAVSLAPTVAQPSLDAVVVLALRCMLELVGRGGSETRGEAHSPRRGNADADVRDRAGRGSLRPTWRPHGSQAPACPPLFTATPRATQPPWPTVRSMSSSSAARPSRRRPWSPARQGAGGGSSLPSLCVCSAVARPVPPVSLRGGRSRPQQGGGCGRVGPGRRGSRRGLLGVE